MKEVTCLGREFGVMDLTHEEGEQVNTVRGMLILRNSMFTLIQDQLV